MKIDYNFFKQHDLVPIEQVADLLDIKINRGKALCPCHDDHSPSMVITKQGKYENKFKCFVCNETGGPVELVMAKMYGIPPSKYHQNREKYRKEYIKSVLFINEHFPGGVSEISKNSSLPPTVPMKILKEIGFAVSPFANIYVHDYSDEELDHIKKTAKDPAKTIQFRLDLYEATEMVYGKLNDYIYQTYEKGESKLKKLLKEEYPTLELPLEVRKEISYLDAKKAEPLIELKNKLRSWLDKNKNKYEESIKEDNLTFEPKELEEPEI